MRGDLDACEKLLRHLAVDGSKCHHDWVMRIGPAEANTTQQVMICPWCERPAIQDVNGSVTVPSNGLTGPSEADLEYILLQCTNCEGASLQVREDLPDFVYAPNEVPQFAYPAQGKLSTDIPDALQHEFEEARSCFNTKAYTAAVVMVRRTLEGIGVDNDIREHNLARQITQMEAKGLIDRSIAEWADGLRVLGNQGAHFTGRKVSREDASDAIHFAEALLNHIYVYRRRFEEFKKRRETKTSPPPSSSTSA
jgi:hypothetical protein